MAAVGIAILTVEDDERIRTSGSSPWGRGLQVLEAETGEDAIATPTLSRPTSC